MGPLRDEVPFMSLLQAPQMCCQCCLTWSYPVLSDATLSRPKSQARTLCLLLLSKMQLMSHSQLLTQDPQEAYRLALSC